MADSRFDDFTRSVAQSRRSLLGGALAVAAGWRGLSGASAKKRRKKKRKSRKAQPNAYGCLNVGAACTSEAQCCSGICEGKKGKKRCLAHDTGTCKQDGQLVPCNNRTDCGCFRTTAGSDVCAGLATSECAVCQRDADCLALGFPSGTACTPGPCESGMACMPPCGTRIPALQDSR